MDPITFVLIALGLATAADGSVPREVYQRRLELQRSAWKQFFDRLFGIDRYSSDVLMDYMLQLGEMPKERAGLPPGFWWDADPKTKELIVRGGTDHTAVMLVANRYEGRPTPALMMDIRPMNELQRRAWQDDREIVCPHGDITHHISLYQLMPVYWTVLGYPGTQRSRSRRDGPSLPVDGMGGYESDDAVGPAWFRCWDEETGWVSRSANWWPPVDIVIDFV